ncbi:hypothetical protein SYNPS1DRAFT_23689 [Syncephalis pseudoplumigaleata]|uniref:Uncharacterized protein n=1 Tax=Syncephalis pseudoplumigaleata TaxID=1712513 RepID=A0A4P9YWI4_9FUNG|nr:hypothetical protein SYNPS1DRAFT_23689 [Syncephalis pseudoplumigaleata]|eukprot:RKP24218.1 hypothetical protein SYNPS1DRAFT_23689 [Syncephalis pseudoplumigaleata]
MPMGGYRTLSGTSMSSPYVAGAAALYLSVKGKIPHAPTEIRQMFQATAKAITHTNQPDSSLASVVRQGAGLLDIDAAIKTTSQVVPSRIGLNDSQHGLLDGGHPGAHTVTITVVNRRAAPVDYTMHHAPSLAIQGYMEARALKKPDFRSDVATISIDKTSQDAVADDAGAGADHDEEHGSGAARRLVRLPRRAVSRTAATRNAHSQEEHHHHHYHYEHRVHRGQASADADDASESDDTSVAQTSSSTDAPIGKFTVTGNSKLAITMTIQPPSLPENERWIYSGFLELYGSNRDVLHVPYMGLSGNLHAQPILDRNGFPFLTRFMFDANVGKVKQKATRHGLLRAKTSTPQPHGSRPFSDEDSDVDADAVEEVEEEDATAESSADAIEEEEPEMRMSLSVDHADLNETTTSSSSSSSSIQTLQQENKASRLRLRVRLAHPTRVLRVDILQILADDPQQAANANVTNTIGIVPNAWITYLGRHSEEADDFATDFAFDGSYTPLNMATKTLFTPNQQNINTFAKGIADGGRGNSKVMILPDGFYRLKVVALLPFGDESQAADWDTWTSPLLRLSTQLASNTNAQKPHESSADTNDQSDLLRKVDIIHEKTRAAVTTGVQERPFQRVQNMYAFQSMDQPEIRKSWDGHVTI